MGMYWECCVDTMWKTDIATARERIIFFSEAREPDSRCAWMAILWKASIWGRLS